MKFRSDSVPTLLLAALLLAAPAHAATTKKAKHPKAVAAAPAPDPQPDATDLIAQAQAAQSRGESDLAVRLAQSAIVASPAMPSTYDTLGDVYAANKEPDAALSYYNEALSIDPADAPAQKAIAALGGTARDQRAANTSAEGSKTGTP